MIIREILAANTVIRSKGMKQEKRSFKNTQRIIIKWLYDNIILNVK